MTATLASSGNRGAPLSAARWSVVLATLAVTGVAVASPAIALGMLILEITVVLAFTSIERAFLFVVIVAPWATLGNVLTDSRLLAVGIDLSVGVIGLATLYHIVPLRSVAGSRWLANSVAALFLLGILELVNPRGIGLGGALEGFRAFYYPLLGLPIGWYLAGQRDERGANALATAVVVSALIVAFMGVRQVLLPGDFELQIIARSQTGLLPFKVTGTDRLRAFSPLPGPFHFGLLMTIGLVLLGVRILARATPGALIAACALALALFLNATRLNWLGAMTAAAVLVLLAMNRKTAARTLRGALIGSLVVAAGLWFFWDSSVLAPARTIAQELILNPTSNSSFIYRVLGWKYEVLPAIQRAPLAGWGTGSAKDGVGLFHSHNVVFKVLLEGGVLGLGLYISTTLAAIAILWKRRSEPTARAALALIAAVHAAGMFGPILDTNPANLFYWALLGVATRATPTVASPAL